MNIGTEGEEMKVFWFEIWMYEIGDIFYCSTESPACLNASMLH